MLGIGLILAALLLSGPAHADSIEATAAYCADRWGNFHTMREDCELEQIVAQSLMGSIFKPYRNLPGMEKAVVFCADRWRVEKFDTHDWPMVIPCVTEQLRAARNGH